MREISGDLICVGATYEYDGVRHEQRILDAFAEPLDHDDEESDRCDGVIQNETNFMETWEVRSFLGALKVLARFDF